MNTVTIIDLHGNITTCEPTFKAVKAALDGAFVTPIRLKDGSILLVDEDGTLKDLPSNTAASVLLAGTQFEGDVLVGKVAHVPKQLVRTVIG